MHRKGCVMRGGKKLSFTKHAFFRVGERLRLTPEEVAEIINSGKYVPIGQEKSKVHKAFYSKPDHQCFIAIHDEDFGKNEIVTILPLDYHHRWEVSEDVFYQAKALANGDQENHSLEIDELTKEIASEINPICFTCYLMEPQTRKVKIARFKVRLESAEVSDYVAQFSGNKEERRLLLDELLRDKVQPEILQTYELQSVYYSIGKNAPMTEYRLD